VFGIYTPDAIAFYNYNGTPYLFTANEGDSREYTAFTEMKRVSAVSLDATNFPTATTLKTDAILGSQESFDYIQEMRKRVEENEQRLGKRP
jgi:hypothetical protein